MRFEDAAKFRDKLQGISSLFESQKLVSADNDKHQDYISYKMQAIDLSKFTSQFRYTDKGFHSGNITFQSRKNGKHGYEYASYYVFNGLIRFFKL